MNNITEYEFDEGYFKAQDDDDHDGVELEVVLNGTPWLIYLTTKDISVMAQQVGLITGQYTKG